MSGIGETLRAIREAAGLTQAQLARKASLSQAAISKAESAQTLEDAGRPDTLAKLAMALSIEPGMLVEPGAIIPSREMGVRLRELREHVGWSIHELAKRSSVNPEFIRRMETGAGSPLGLVNTSGLAAGLAVSAKDLVHYLRGEHDLNGILALIETGSSSDEILEDPSTIKTSGKTLTSVLDTSHATDGTELPRSSLRFISAAEARESSIKKETAVFEKVSDATLRSIDRELHAVEDIAAFDGTLHGIPQQGLSLVTLPRHTANELVEACRIALDGFAILRKESIRKSFENILLATIVAGARRSLPALRAALEQSGLRLSVDVLRIDGGALTEEDRATADRLLQSRELKMAVQPEHEEATKKLSAVAFYFGVFTDPSGYQETFYGASPELAKQEIVKLLADVPPVPPDKVLEAQRHRERLEELEERKATTAPLRGAKPPTG